jgi:predicted ABC-type transport system involved in lysophospholipase L1 biosynthesis ATPase subunit
MRRARHENHRGLADGNPTSALARATRLIDSLYHALRPWSWENASDFGSTPVLDGVSVDIADGEFVGPSGCGKSTLLRMVAGLETITSGEVAIDGRVVKKLEPKGRDCDGVSELRALSADDCRQNLAFALELARLDRETIKRKAAAAAASLGLEPLLGRYPRQLSGGQRQRVAMGSCGRPRPQGVSFSMNLCPTLTRSCGYRCAARSRSSPMANQRRSNVPPRLTSGEMSFSASDPRISTSIRRTAFPALSRSLSLWGRRLTSLRVRVRPRSSLCCVKGWQFGTAKL